MSLSAQANVTTAIAFPGAIAASPDAPHAADATKSLRDLIAAYEAALADYDLAADALGRIEDRIPHVTMADYRASPESAAVDIAVAAYFAARLAIFAFPALSTADHNTKAEWLHAVFDDGSEEMQPEEAAALLESARALG